MNYIGSKLKLSSWIKQEITATVGTLSDKVFCDIFAGTGIVGRTFKREVKQVISNDLEYYSFVLNMNYIVNHKQLGQSEALIGRLNDDIETEPLKGKLFNAYAPGGGGGRQYFSDENAMKIDAIRQKIELWKKSDSINNNEYYFLLASLLESADKVANTASVYGAFLKKIKGAAQQRIVLRPAIFDVNENEHQVFQMDANELIRNISGDILYLDPPYNSRQYGANYHLLNTIALYDSFVPRGKTGLRSYTKSRYCSKATVVAEFDDLIKNAEFKYIFLSYNDEGLMSVADIKRIMEKYGKYSLTQQRYQRFKADNARRQKQNSTIEYLHILEK